MLLEMLTGHETFPSQSAKVHVFSSPTREVPSNGSEIHVLAALQLSERRLRRNGSSQTFQIAPGYRDELGRWTRSVIDAPEGALFKIYAYRNTSWNTRTVHANQYIVMRENAAYRRIRISLSGAPNATFTHAEVKGRFDMLSMEDAIALGAVVRPQFAHHFAPNNVGLLMEVTELEPEVRSRPQVETVVIQTTPDAEPVEVRRRRTGRQMEF